MSTRTAVIKNKGKKPLYFDTAATTRVDDEVVSVMLEQLGSAGCFANPSSAAHAPGRLAASLIEDARAVIAGAFRCQSSEVIFTSGATEANNLALRGLALANADFGRHLVTSCIEHKAILECCASLEREGFEVTYLSPTKSGWVDPADVDRAVRDDTLLVSLMHTNNETGVVQPVDEVASVAAARGVLLHVDAAQAAGKFAIELDRTPIDMLSLSAHKFHGPKGIGGLIVRNRPRLRLRPLLYGGGQEYGLRPGTLPTHQIMGFAKALELAAQRRQQDLPHVHRLRDQFIAGLSSQLAVTVHGDESRASPYIVNFSIPGIGSDALINQLDGELAIASGSACSSGTVEPSYVLRAMGLEGETLYGAVRVSFERNHTSAEVTEAVERIVAAVGRMQELDNL